MILWGCGLEVAGVSARKERVTKVKRQKKAVTRGPFPAMPNYEAKFELVDGATSTKNAYCNIPLAYWNAAIRRLKQWEEQDIIEVAEGATEWISGMSVVPKGRDFRLVVNMMGPNRAIKRQYYPLPTLESIRVKLCGMKYFAKLDLTSAFFDLMLERKFRELTMFMAPGGRYRFKRLCFGVNAAPEIFQERIE
jgi:hypothetical protein